MSLFYFWAAIVSFANGFYVLATIFALLCLSSSGRR